MMHFNLIEEKHTIRVQSDPIDIGTITAAWVATMLGLTALLYLVSLR